MQWHEVCDVNYYYSHDYVNTFVCDWGGSSKIKHNLNNATENITLLSKFLPVKTLSVQCYACIHV